MKAYKHLVKHAIKDLGLVVSVWDGEEWGAKRTDNQKVIFDVIDSVEESQLIFIDKEGKKVGWALVIDYEGEPENSVVDHTANEWMEAWSKSYDATVTA